VYADINGLRMFYEIRGISDPAKVQAMAGRADMLMTMIPPFLDAP
jgi:hypothetical protein